MKKAVREVSEDPEIIAINPAKEDVESRLAYRELAQWLRKELSTYSPEMQEAFKMYYLDGYSLEEVAKQLGIRKNTLSQRFSRMRNKLTNDAVADSVILALVVLFITQTR
jgi:RNA polymerase sigma factor (sigma-70 family)